MNGKSKMKFIGVWALAAVLALPAAAQNKSAKRGLCWDENTQSLTAGTVEKMMPGVAWVYNWGVAPARDVANLGVAGGMDFAPMCWTAKFDEKRLRAYLDTHPGVKYLLGFNEPNFMYQANLTPKQAAAEWSKVERIAADYNLKLVAPVLNFTGDHVGGRAWTPLEWLDEFVGQYKKKHKRLPKMDCLALHCYMNWYSATTWFATEYFYKDLFDPQNETCGKYPRLVELLEDFHAAHGHFPRMMLTEFCAWEGNKDGFELTAESQIDQMTQKVQKLELSDRVEGYAWFMANGTAAVTPFYSIFQTNWPDSELSDLGRVYVHMSAFDREHFYTPADRVAAKDYIDASTDDSQVRLRPGTDAGSSAPLQVEFLPGAFALYQIDAPRTATYRFRVRVKSDADAELYLFWGGGDRTRKTPVATAGQWQEVELEVPLEQGQRTITIGNKSEASFVVSEWQFD